MAVVVAAAVGVASFGGSARAQVAGPPDPDTPAPLYTINGLGPSKGDNVVLLWDEELLQAIRANPGGTGPDRHRPRPRRRPHLHVRRLGGL
jgi:hypothetical protein